MNIKLQMSNFKSGLLACLILGFLTSAQADTSLEENYPGATQIQVIHETGGHIVILAPDLMRISNPATKRWSNQKILLVIKKVVSLLRKTQLDGVDVVSTTIKSDDADGDLEAFSIPAYGRALIARMMSPQDQVSVVLDLKGTGTETPVMGFNTNGLLSLPAALKEFVIAHLIHKIFNYVGVEYEVVPHIAVSASDFFIKRGDGSQVMAAKLVRGPHRRLIRPDQTHFFVHYQPAIQIEKILQLFGISSFQTLNGESFLNIQGTPTKQLFDFTHYSIKDEGAEFPPGTFTYFNALPGNSFATVPYPIAAHFPKPIPRIGLIHNLLENFSEDKIYGQILAIYNQHCADSLNCKRQKLFDELSRWAQRFLHQVEDQLKAKTFTNMVIEKLGPREGVKILADIYPAFQLNKKGTAEVQQLLHNPQFNSDEAPHLEILRLHPSLEAKGKTPLPDARTSKTNFILNVSAKYRKVQNSEAPNKVTLQIPVALPSSEISAQPPTSELKIHFCSRLVNKIRTFFKSR